MPTFKHGKNTSVQIKDNDTGGTLRDISNVLTDSNFQRAVESADVTAFGASAKEYIAGLADGTVSISGHFDQTVDGYLSGILGKGPVDFEYYPTGTAAGANNVKYTGKMMLVSYDPSSPVGDKVGFTAEFQLSGAVARAVIA